MTATHAIEEMLCPLGLVDAEATLDMLSGPFDYHDIRGYDDWRGHVPLAVSSLWDLLSLEARVATFVTAVKAAERGLY